jgi:hypothetical protein
MVSCAEAGSPYGENIPERHRDDEILDFSGPILVSGYGHVAYVTYKLEGQLSEMISGSCGQP